MLIFGAVTKSYITRMFKSNSGEPYAGKLHVRFLEEFISNCLFSEGDKFTYVNPLEPDCLDLIDKYVKLGFKAIKLQPLRHAYCADSEIVDPVLDKAEEYGIPVCIHSGHPPYSLPWQIGLLAERHPNCKVLMIHMGHGHGVYIDAALKMARRYPNIYLEMSGMPMHTKIKEAYDTVGHDRILFGTDTPFHHPTVEMQKVLMSGVDEQGLEDIFYNNAKKFFDV